MLDEGEGDDNQKDDDSAGEALRIRRFEAFLCNTPELLPKVRESLTSLIDDLVKEDFVMFAEAWLETQRRKLDEKPLSRTSSHGV